MTDFRNIQTGTGWGRVLAEFAGWCAPQPGWLALDVGCGPGLFPALLRRRGCRAVGVDLHLEQFLPQPLHADVAVANALELPFASQTFHLVTATNLLFLLAEPERALREMRRVLREDGWLACINPSERLSVATVTSLARQRGLTGLARDSLLNWARRAEAGHRWTEQEVDALFSDAGLRLVENELRMGTGLARFSRAQLD